MPGPRCKQRVAWLVVLVGASSAISRGEDDWSPWRPLGAPSPPAIADAQWAVTPIDRFVLQQLRERGWEPAPPVDRRVWLRRVTFDLIGLPPTMAELREFLLDRRPDELAYQAVVDRLLASPHYGERWSRHWMDVVRYADTDGFAIDGERHTLWRYRDYLIRSFNADRPFDALIREQLAGDEWGVGPDRLAATSFFRLGPYEADNMVPENRRQDFLNEMTNAVGSAFLGMTVGCARCHDHKYDPIPQADYYRLQAFLAPADRGNPAAPLTEREAPPAVERRKSAALAEQQRLERAAGQQREQLRAALASALQQPPSAVSKELFDQALQGEAILIPPRAAAQTEQAAQHAVACEEAPTATDRPPAPRRFSLDARQRKKLERLQEAAENYSEDDRYADVVCGIRVAADAEAPTTHVLLNGNVFSEGDAVAPGALSAVPNWSPSLQQWMAAIRHRAQGRRRVLAEWIASPHNPLTARVLANRIWQHHFGRGIVATPNDFGLNGSGASHADLLDYLARTLIENQWRLKPLHRMLVLTQTYRMASHHPRWEEYAEQDPGNQWLWRAHPQRLEAESLRDALLLVSGQLKDEQGGPGVYEALPSGMGVDYPFFTWHPSSEDQRARRSIYLFQRRNLVHPFMEAFDVAGMTESCERRQTSITPSQALSLFNGELASQCSLALARRLRQQPRSSEDQWVGEVFERALLRPPTEIERASCHEFLSAQRALYQATEAKDQEISPDARAAAELSALRDLCLAVFNSNEFVYLD